ncbi:hypothetical protein CALCODRAFT_494340 [Calocera cornea HHB12733]|uniref:Uncharacterized protein n=1 Tax=Calocera cornea HHB12733 TaxID=1353952 RepID=A0A165H560_9BASI|nr:hypothetical protein CALCODRAFT_494340 [Calocera cornea HHB12733]
MTTVTEYNITLGPESPVINFLPFRDSDPSQGWNASYTGNAIYAHGLGSGTPYRRTQKDGAQLELDFDGTGVYFCYSTEQGASMSLTIDGQPVGSAVSSDDTFCSATGADTLAFASGLSYGSHQAVLDVAIPQSSSSLLFYKGIVTIGAGVDGSQIDANAPTYVDDRDSGWTYGPLPQFWTVHTTSSVGDSSHTRTGTCTYASAVSASYTFTGAGAVFLIGGVANESFGYTISLDGTSASYNATNFWTSTQQLLFFQGGLNPAVEHTLIATDYNPNQPTPPQPRACFNIDALGLVQTTAPSVSSGSALGSGHAGLTEGVVAGVVVLLIPPGLGYWWYRRRRSKHANKRGATPFVLPSTMLDVEERREKAFMPAMTTTTTTSNTSPSPEEARPSLPPTHDSQGRRMTRTELYQLPIVELVDELNGRLESRPTDSASEAPPMYAPHA